MADKRRVISGRRKFLKTTAVAGTFALAGCSGSGGGGGDGGSGGGSGGDSGGSSGGSSGGDTAGTPNTGGKWEGVEIEFWNRMHFNTQRAEPAIKQAIQNFENDTGATVNVNYASGSALQKWLTLIDQGQRPHLMDQPSEGSGPFVDLGVIKPYEEYSRWFSEELRNNISWMMDVVGPMVYGGFDGKAYDLKFSNEGVRTFLVRTDYMEEAGLSPEDDFPPESFEESVQLGRTLQEDSSADYGWQIYGTSGDITDTCTEDWPATYAGIEGRILNEDWTDVNITNDAFIRTYEQFIGLKTENGLSHPDSVSMSDEDATQTLINGSGAMTSVPPATYGDLLNQAPEMVSNGQFKFGTGWKGPSGARGIVGGDGIMLTNPPDDADASEWEEAQEAAIDMMENYLYFSDFFQERMFQTLGGGPVREDVGEDQILGAVNDTTGYENTNVIEATLRGAFDSEEILIEPQAPMYGAIQYNIMPPQLQQAMQGNKSVEDALTSAAQEARNRFF